MARSNSRSIFVSTACIPGKQPIMHRVSSYRRYGLVAIDLGAGVSVDKLSLLRVANTGCRFLVHNYFPPPADPFVLNLASADVGIREKSLDFVLEALNLTAHLGSPFYSVHAGFITDPIRFDASSLVFPAPQAPEEGKLAMDRFTAALEIALNCAQHVGVQLLIENNVCSEDARGKLLLQTADEFLELFRVLPSQHLGLLLDTGHLNVTARTFGFDCTSFVDDVAPRIRAFHVHGNDGLADSHQPIRSASWVLGVLRRPQFADLPVVVEARFETVGQLRQHVIWLETELGRHK